MKTRISRRRFLQRAGGVGTAWILLSDSRSVRGAPAHRKLNVALVGLGGRGSWFVDTMPNMENVVALCDVNEDKAQRAREAHPNLPFFHDYRQMLDKMDRDIEAVVVATPDHTHAPISLSTMNRGKHVYCEKPLTRTIAGAVAARLTARQKQVATQMGNQGTASGTYRRGVELIQQGVIGQVQEVLVWKDSGGRNHQAAPEGEKPIPPYLQWDLWLGPARSRPFHPAWLGWQGWRDFGTCELGNWASHTANLAFRALRFDTLWNASGQAEHPLSVRARVSEINRLSFPRWEVIEYRIPARGSLPPVTLTWHNGPAPGSRELIESRLGDGLDWGDKKEKKWADHAGTLIVGSEGMIHSNGHNTEMRLLPEDKFKDVEVRKPLELPQSPGHEREWLEACRGGKPAWSNFDYAGPLTEFLMLGNLATQFEGELLYDPAATRITNHEAADRALTEEPRPGWVL